VIHSKHCKICENLDFNIKYGTKCGLTNEKPEFKSKCLDIKFGENAEKYITEISVENKLIEKSKIDYIGTFFIYLLIGFGFIFSGIFLMEKLFGFGIFHTVTIIIIGIGFLVLPKSFGALNTFFSHKKVAKKKLNELNKVLGIYKRKFEIDLDIKNIHGINEIKSEVKIYKY
jgi:hypothetical protein